MKNKRIFKLYVSAFEIIHFFVFAIFIRSFLSYLLRGIILHVPAASSRSMIPSRLTISLRSL